MGGTRSILRIRELVIVMVMWVMLLAGCSSAPTRAPATYTVKRGDTLYSIAWRYGLDYREVARKNRIGRDYVIYPGQVLYLVPSNRATAQSTARSPSTPRTPAPIPPTSAAVRWQWPADNVAVTLTERPNYGQGLTMAGRIGQEIHAAADGNVVYVGSGLLGYGQLVIIKHNETYLSAYAHTETVLVREGETARAGQVIATMGEGPGGQPMLYFEIRLNGKPVDPLGFLPPRSS